MHILFDGVCEGDTGMFDIYFTNACRRGNTENIRFMQKTLSGPYVLCMHTSWAALF